MNRVILVGVLTDIPKEFVFRDNKGCELKLVVQTNDMQQTMYPRDPYFFTVNLWNKNAEYALNSLDKGDLVSIEGYLKSEQQTSSNGRDYFRISIVVERVKKIPLAFNQSGNRYVPNQNRFNNRIDYKSFNNQNNNNGFNNGFNKPFDVDDEPFDPPATTEIKGYRESYDLEDIKKVEPKEFAQFSTPSSYKANHSLIDEDNEEDLSMDMDDWMNENQ
ncbi:single-stranded DNA-binding protein [Mycoplasma sp. E35C]|uniref:single-stranded DNA-binding protein n=1 Tax=Mycoplasma sp. E35C TaxID=2801918 RepID=UPI001CA41F81|nr:single-stranded DNA-binding protein [Mycoplasma sp. E35C]QZX49045.1 single-stranded DNA-binding protein [Mycoplasma sp. E35C]